MKVLFVEARRKQDINAEKAVDEFVNSNKIRKICIVASMQYLDLVSNFRKEFEKRGIKAYSSKGNKTAYENQIIGCDVNAALNVKKKVDAFIVLSDGKFHALQLALSTEKPVFRLQENSLKRVGKNELNAIKNKRKAAVINFLNSDKIGIIVSSKPGQFKIKYALQLKKKIEKKNKKAFLFLGNTINIYELENFPCKSWVNTACPALTLDSAKIVNYDEIEKFL